MMTAKMDRLLDTTFDWGVTHGVRIVLILLVVWVAIRAVHALATLMHKRIAAHPDALRRDITQVKTTAAIVEHTGTAIVSFVGVLLVASELGFNLTPILASAGIVGVAVGFGAQSLVKDVLAGCFVLLENQFGVGDVIRTGAHTGEVEVITLRTTCLRDGEGAYIIIPNSDLGRVTNFSKVWATAVVDVDVADGQDLDAITAVLSETAMQLAVEWPDRIIDKPAVLGIERMTETGVSLRITAKTAPLKQWEVSRELRKRLKTALFTHGIAQPVPKRQLLPAEPAPSDTPPPPSQPLPMIVPVD